MPEPTASSAVVVVTERGRERVIARLPTYLFDVVLVVADEGGVTPLDVLLADVVARLPGRPSPDSITAYASELDYFDLTLRRARDDRGRLVLSLALPAGIAEVDLPSREHVRSYLNARRRYAQSRGRAQARVPASDSVRSALDGAERALLIGDTRDAQHALSQIAYDAGGLARSLSRTTRHQIVGKLHETRADLCMQHGDGDASLREVERARKHYDALNDQEALIRLETISVASLRIAGRLDDALRRARTLTSLVQTKRTPAAIGALCATHAPAVYAGATSEALVAAERGLSAALATANGMRVAEACLRLSQVALMLGNVEKAASLIERAASIPETHVSRWLSIWLWRWKFDLGLARREVSLADLDAIFMAWQFAWHDRNRFQQMLILAALREAPMCMLAQFERDASFRASVACWARAKGLRNQLLRQSSVLDQTWCILDGMAVARLRTPQI